VKFSGGIGHTPVRKWLAAVLSRLYSLGGSTIFCRGLRHLITSNGNILYVCLCVFVQPPVKVVLGPEVEVYDVELVKNNVGLGITIAGYISDKPNGVYSSGSTVIRPATRNIAVRQQPIRWWPGLVVNMLCIVSVLAIRWAKLICRWVTALVHNQPPM